MAQERKEEMVGYRVSVAKFQRPEADATNYLTYRVSDAAAKLDFWQPPRRQGPKESGRGGGDQGGGEGGCRDWSVPAQKTLRSLM